MRALHTGIALMVIFLLSDGARMIYATSHLYQNFNPFILVLVFGVVSFLASAIQYLIKRAAQLKDVSSPKISLLPTKRDQNKIIYYSMLNVFTLVSWASSQFMIAYMNAPLASAIAVSIGPIIISFGAKNKRMVCISISFASLALLALITTKYSTSSLAFNTAPNMILGISLSVICGFSIYINTVASHKLSMLGEQAITINFKRSIFVIFFSAIVSFQAGLLPQLIANPIEISWFALAFLLLPQIVLQKSIKILGPNLTTIFLTFAPLFAALAQFAFFQISISTHLLIGLFLQSILMVVLAILNSSARV